jgi:hypothetical protein
MSKAAKDLLYKAMTCLADKYDVDDDCFFVVITKDGKNPALEVGDQMIIGEINVKTLVAFILEATRQVCGSVDMDPHVFISRYITGALVEQERMGFQGFGLEIGDDLLDEEEVDEEVEEDEDEDEVFGSFILDPKKTTNIN